jgi:hypothetical protein
VGVGSKESFRPNVVRGLSDLGPKIPFGFFKHRYVSNGLKLRPLRRRQPVAIIGVFLGLLPFYFRTFYPL